MPGLTIIFGVALITIGVGTYIGAGEEASFWAFFLQMILGMIAIALGIGAILKKPMKMHLMHGAVILATMGVIVPAVKLVMFIVEQLETRQQQMDALRIILTVLASGAYVYAAVQSFIKARRARADGVTGKDPTPPTEPAADLGPDPATGD